MDNFLIQIPSNKRAFFLSLMNELPFVSVTDEIAISGNDVYVNAILKSEQDIEEGKVLSHSDLIKEVESWK